MRKNVFISSTYIDLLTHRKAIWELLEKYEVNVKGMEAFGARKETPLETCLNEVSQSDIYIGVIAYRFGSIEESTGKSFTQLEYERAIDENKEILIYLINEEDSKVAIKHIDFDQKREKLLNFKMVLKDKHTIDTFTTPENLVKKLKTRFDELLLEAPKKISGEKNYEESKNIIERFLLLPKTYSDRDILLTIEFKGNAFPISRDLCSSFGFSYGKTIGVPIEICKPEIKNAYLDFLIIEEKDVEVYFNRKEAKKINIIGRLLFSDKKINKTQADFFDRTSFVYKKNPSYDPLKPSFDIHTLSSISENISQFQSNPRYIKALEEVRGDGKAIIVLRSTI